MRFSQPIDKLTKEINIGIDDEVDEVSWFLLIGF